MWQVWHFVAFQHVSYLCNPLHRFRKMTSIFRGKRSTLETSIVTLRGRRRTSEVSCYVLLRIALSGPRQIVTMCKFLGRRCILWDVIKIEGNLARNIGFEIVEFGVLGEDLVGKRQFCSYKVRSFQEVVMKCSIWGSDVSRFDFLVLLRRRLANGGSC